MPQTIAKASARKLEKFFKAESSGGILMIGTTILAMVAANGGTADLYKAFIDMPLTLGLGDLMVSWPIKEWIKEVLMVLFFLVVGMELKREMQEGFLADKKQIALPLVAAVGGMLAPALVFLLFNRDIEEHWNGWAIPSATDIAFALSILMLAGKRLPPALKIFLLAIAIFDDLGAILVIAFFYSSQPEIMPLLWVAAGIITLYLCNRMNIMYISVYIVIGIGLWFALHASGIHTTIGGVLVGMAIPLRDPEETSNSPLNTCMHFLHPWVTFLILPIFAFTAAGVNLDGLSLEVATTPLVLGVTLGLFIGKQIGIFGFSFVLIKLGLARLPDGTNWGHIYGVSILAGIGFTMSLFIGMLAFDDPFIQDEVKLGVLMGSLLASIAGWLVLKLCKPSEPPMIEARPEIIISQTAD